MNMRDFVLEQTGNEDVIFFDNPSYDEASIGLSVNDKVVYDFDKTVESLMKQYGWSKGESIEFLDCNTLCFIDISNVMDKMIPTYLAKQYYIALAKKRLLDFGVVA